MIDFSTIVSCTFMVLLVCGAMADGVLRLRFHVGAHWRAMACCIASVTMSSAMVIAMTWLAVINRDTLRLLKDDRRIEHATPDWGKDFPPERRTELSKFIAQSNYVVTGIVGNHIDLAGTFRLYELTDGDLQARRNQEASFRMLQRAAVLFGVGAFGSLLLPWIGLIIGFIVRPGVITRALISYPKDAGN